MIPRHTTTRERMATALWAVQERELANAKINHSPLPEAVDAFAQLRVVNAVIESHIDECQAIVAVMTAMGLPLAELTLAHVAAFSPLRIADDAA
jgi:hypothetical protein